MSYGDRSPAEHQTDLQYVMCGGGQIGITDNAGLLLRCLTFPVGELPDIQVLRVPNRAACSTRIGVHPALTDP